MFKNVFLNKLLFKNNISLIFPECFFTEKYIYFIKLLQNIFIIYFNDEYDYIKFLKNKNVYEDIIKNIKKNIDILNYKNNNKYFFTKEINELFDEMEKNKDKTNDLYDYFIINNFIKEYLIFTYIFLNLKFNCNLLNEKITDNKLLDILEDKKIFLKLNKKYNLLCENVYDEYNIDINFLYENNNINYKYNIFINNNINFFNYINYLINYILQNDLNIIKKFKFINF